MNIQSVSTMTYHDLQDTLDKVIGKIGLSSTIRLLQKVVQGHKVEATESDKVKLITSYLILRSQTIFNLKEDKFFVSDIPEYRAARRACYHLLRKYTDGSHSCIAEQFGQQKRNILYHSQKCEDMLSLPQFHKPFVERYKMLENSLLEFITKLNSDKNK